MENKNKNLSVDYLKSIIYSNDTYNLIIRLVIYLVIISLILIFVINGYVSDKVEELKAAINDIKTSELLIAGKGDYKGINNQIEYLNEFSKENKKMLTIKSKELFEKINSALPEKLTENYIANFFEELFLSLSQQGNEIILNSINIGKGINQEVNILSKNINYYKYPILISYISSNTKSEQLLDLIQASGILDEKYYYKGRPIPIMTTSSVSLNFQDDDKIIRNHSLQFFMYSYKQN